MNAVYGGQILARCVQLGGAGDHGCVAFSIQRIFFECRREYAYTQWFAEYELISRTRICIALEFVGMHQTHHHQPIDGFDRINRVTASDGDACSSTHRFATGQYLAYDLDRQFVDRHTDQCQCHDGCATHGIHIRDGIGGGDTAKVEGIIDDGHEKIGGGNQCLFIIELVDSSIISSFYTDQQLRRHWET